MSTLRMFLCSLATLFTLVVASEPIWVMGAPRLIPAESRAVVTMNDGRVLAMGGYRQSWSIKECEIYDPRTRVWTMTGATRTTHRDGQAVLLKDGRVMVIGDILPAGDPANNTANCEIFDPATGIWRMAAPLLDQRVHPKVFVLNDGTVLVVAGSMSMVTSTPTVMRYDPATDTWRYTGSLIHGRNETCAATALADGRILVSGGGESMPDGSGRGLNSCEVYDPANGSWSLIGTLNGNQANHQNILLTDGRVLVAGGFQRECQIFDPATGAWSFTGSLTIQRYGFACARLDDGRVLVVGGRYLASTTQNGLNSTDIFSPDLATVPNAPIDWKGRWAPGPPMAAIRSAPGLVRLASGNLLVIGGDSYSDIMGTSSEILVFAPVLTGPASAQGRVGEPLSLPIATQHDPRQFSAIGLPAGLAINPMTGVLGGIPAQAGTFAITITATNESGSATLTMTLTITTPGTGLLAQYWSGQDRTCNGPASITRIDPVVDFNWGYGSPDATVAADRFTARWSGSFVAPTTETYQIFVTGDDGVRLWVDGQAVINAWFDESERDHVVALPLTAGRKYSLQMDYYENRGRAVARLSWASPSMPRTVIPRSALFPATIGSGLQAEYRTNQDRTFLDLPTLTRIDGVVDFNWGYLAPAPLISADHFTVRWQGRIQVPAADAYTFTVTGDDGIRLWIDGQLVVNAWKDQVATDHSGVLSLSNSQLHDIRLEYYENCGKAVARLSWSSATMPLAVVPKTNLYPIPAVPIAPPLPTAKG